MIDSLINFVILITIIGIICLFLRWLMVKLKFSETVKTIIWVVVGLLALLAALGMFGFGPMQGPWRRQA